MLQHVVTGQPLRIPASDYNAFVDVALGRKRPIPSPVQSVSPLPAAAGMLRIRNDSGVTCPRYGILQVDAPVVRPSVRLESWLYRPLMMGIAPAAASIKIAVTDQRLRDGACGLAYTSGACPVRVEMIAESHAAAISIEGDVTMLRSAVAGIVELLWVEPIEERTDSDVAWCMARLGAGAGIHFLHFIVDEILDTIRVKGRRVVPLDRLVKSYVVESVQTIASVDPDVPAADYDPFLREGCWLPAIEDAYGVTVLFYPKPGIRHVDSLAGKLPSECRND